MPPSTTPTQANTGDGTILPPPAAVAPTAQSDQIQAAGLSAAPVTAVPSATPLTPTPTPAFNFAAPDMPTMTNVDASQYHDMTSLAAAEAAARSGLVNNQNDLEKNVFGQYQQAITGQGSALDRYNALSTQMNLPLYQQQVDTIKGLLSRLSNNVTTRAQGTFMNQAQRDQLEASEGKDLNNQLAPLAQAQTSAESNIAKIMGFQDQDNQAKLDPIKQYLANLSGAFGRQLSGMDANNSSASTALQSKLDAEEKARQDAEQARQFEATQALQRETQAAQAKYNDFMAGIARQQAATTAASVAPKLTQAQVNAASFVAKNGGPGSVANYKSAPLPSQGWGTQALGSIQNVLQAPYKWESGIGSNIANAFRGIF